MKKILCFGDSNTWGHNPEDASRLEERWTVLLGELLTDGEITEDGACGRSTKYDVPGMDSSNGIKVFKEKYADTKSKFDLVIIMLGTNDTLSCFDCNASETAKSLHEFINLIRKYEISDNILIVSPILITDYALKHPVFKDLYNEDSLQKSKNMAGEIEHVAEEDKVFFMDAAKISSPSNIDGIHMNTEEHKKLAYAMRDKINEVLQ